MENHKSNDRTVKCPRLDVEVMLLATIYETKARNVAMLASTTITGIFPFSIRDNDESRDYLFFR
jgi:hypothetical protein